MTSLFEIHSNLVIFLKQIKQKVFAVEVSEGVGARVRRTVGSSQLKNLDPFLLLDAGKVKKPAGKMLLHFCPLFFLVWFLNF